ncbi:MAG: molecular chaperone DnaK, partial [Nanoarchaeota archaeon]|nr:molecular chaperone DnaK [Nanoarchaeota archaeon]
LKGLKDAIEKENVDDIKEKMDSLQKTAQEIGAKMYQQASQQQAEKPGSEEEQPEEEKKHKKKGDKVVDADFKVEDEEKEKK